MITRAKIGMAIAAALLLGLSGAPAVLAQDSEPAGDAEASRQSDPRVGDEAYQRSQRLLRAIDDILADAAEERAKARDLPSQENFVIPPLWRDTREDNEARVRTLLDSALEIVTDAPVVEMQEAIAAHRASIDKMRDQITELKQERITAPEDGFLPGVFTETQGSIGEAITQLEQRIAENRARIAEKKAGIHNALEDAGVKIGREQLDLLLDSVLGGDLLRLVTAFETASEIDKRLGELLDAASDNPKAARRYFAMHASLFAMLLHAQDALIDKIDAEYSVKLQAILTDIRRTRQETYRLLAQQNRPDQKRALDANLKAQNFAERAAEVYQDYLQAQRKQLVEARRRTVRDLRVADNTYRTVEASFQLRALMQSSRETFQAIRRLEAPGFERIFRNESLRKEFEQLTRELAPGS